VKKVLVGFALIGVLALACGEDEGITRPPEVIPDATSPVDALKGVEKSFTRRDINLLEGMLSEDFVFYFDPDDVGQNPPGSEYVIPKSWPYTKFRETADYMFVRAYAINLSVPTGGIGAPAPGQTEYKAEDVSVSLLVMVNELSGYIADGGYCDFEFEVYYNKQKQKRWRLTGWWDHTSEYLDARPGVEPTSLGKILAFYQVGG
jgi:hypothetical protein